MSGVNTNGAAATVMNFAVLEKGMPWHVLENMFKGSTKKYLCQKHEIRVDPSSVDPISPFPICTTSDQRDREHPRGVGQDLHGLTIQPISLLTLWIRRV